MSPSLISLMVSVNVKHHVYLLTTGICRVAKARDFRVTSYSGSAHTDRRIAVVFEVYRNARLFSERW